MKLIKLGTRIFNMDLVTEIKAHEDRVILHFAAPDQHGAMTATLTDRDEQHHFLSWIERHLDHTTPTPTPETRSRAFQADAGPMDQGGATPAQQQRDAEAQQLLLAMEQGLRAELEGTEVYAPSVGEDEAVTRAFREPPAADVNLNVPYVHQMWDTPNEFDGRWACGPTSTAMVLAYYGLLEPKPISLRKPTPHENSYGWYVSNAFAYNGHTFDARSATKTGSGAGLYGSIVHDGFAHADTKVGGVRKGFIPVLRTFFGPTGNTVEFVSKPTWREVSESLDDGHPVILSGHVFGYPHIITIRGYSYDKATNAFHWIINDPHGYTNKGTYDGENVAYRWFEIYHPDGEPSKYMFRIRGGFKPA